MKRQRTTHRIHAGCIIITIHLENRSDTGVACVPTSYLAAKIKHHVASIRQPVVINHIIVVVKNCGGIARCKVVNREVVPRKISGAIHHRMIQHLRAVLRNTRPAGGVEHMGVARTVTVHRAHIIQGWRARLSGEKNFVPVRTCVCRTGGKGRPETTLHSQRAISRHTRIRLTCRAVDGQRSVRASPPSTIDSEPVHLNGLCAYHLH